MFKEKFPANCTITLLQVVTGIFYYLNNTFPAGFLITSRKPLAMFIYFSLGMGIKMATGQSKLIRNPKEMSLHLTSLLGCGQADIMHLDFDYNVSYNSQ